MQRFIIDASAVMANFLTEPETPQAQALFRAFVVSNRTIDLVLPEFGKLECVNVIWKHIRFHKLPTLQGEAFIRVLLQYPFNLYSLEGLYEEAYAIGMQYNLAIYDSVYIALAKHLNCPLITLDQKQASAAAQEHVTLKPITEFVQ